MLNKFQIPEESANFARRVEEYTIKMEEVLDEFCGEKESIKQVKEFITSLIK